MDSKKVKSPFALYGNTASYNLSAVSGEAFYDTDNWIEKG